MIEIVVANISLDLISPNMRLEKSFGLEVDVLMQQSYSFPFSLSNSQKNMQALNYTSVERTHERQKKFDCIIRILGIDYRKAVLNIIGFNENEIRCNIAWGVAAFAVMEKSLREIDLGDDIFIDISNLPLALTNFDDANFENKICFPPFFAPNWYDVGNANNTAFCGIVNNYHRGTERHVNNDGGNPNTYSFAPMVYVYYLLQRIFMTEGYTINGNAWNDAEMRQLVMFSNRNLDKLVELYRSFVSSKNNQYFDFSQGSTQVRLIATNVAYPDADNNNRWNNTDSWYNILVNGDYTIKVEVDLKRDTSVFVSGALADYITLEIYMGGSALTTITLPNHDGVFTFTHAFTGVAGQDVWVYLTHSGVGFTNFWILKGSTIEVVNVGTVNINVSEQYIKLKNHVPDWTCAELVGAFKEWANVKFDVDDYRKVVNMNFIAKEISRKPIDITKKVLTKPNYVLNEFEGITLGYDFGDSDTYIADGIKKKPFDGYLGEYGHYDLPNASRPGQTVLYKPTNEVWVAANNLYWDSNGSLYADITIGNGKTEKRMKFAPMFMGLFELADGSTQAIPKTGEKCTSTMYNMGENDYTPRFMFYRGQSINVYPYASSTVYDNGDNVVGNYSFDLISANSIYTQLHQSFYNILLTGEEVELFFNADALTINEFENWVKVMNDFLEFLSKTITITIEKGKVKGRITALRL